MHKPIPLKQIFYLHEEPHIVWEEEVNQMMTNEELQYVVIGKLSHG